MAFTPEFTRLENEGGELVEALGSISEVGESAKHELEYFLRFFADGIGMLDIGRHTLKPIEDEGLKRAHVFVGDFLPPALALGGRRANRLDSGRGPGRRVRKVGG